MTLTISGKVNASLNHLLSIFGLGALADGLSLRESDFLLKGVRVVEPDGLVEGERLFVLVLNLAAHALVLEAVVAHLVP